MLSNELLAQLNCDYNPNKTQAACYNAYLSTNIKTTRNDPQRSAAARYKLVKNAEFNALALLPHYLIEAEIFQTLDLNTLNQLGHKGVFSAQVTNKLDFTTEHRPDLWSSMYEDHKKLAHERLWDQALSTLNTLYRNNNTELSAYPYATDTLIYIMFYMVRRYRQHFNTLWIDTKKMIDRTPELHNHYLLCKFATIAAYAGDETPIIDYVSNSEYQSVRIPQYLSYADGGAQSRLPVEKIIQGGSNLKITVATKTYQKACRELGQYSLKCLRSSMYQTEGLTLTALWWLSYAVNTLDPNASLANSALLQKASKTLNIEGNRLALSKSTLKYARNIQATLGKHNILTPSKA